MTKLSKCCNAEVKESELHFHCGKCERILHPHTFEPMGELLVKRLKRNVSLMRLTNRLNSLPYEENTNNE